MKKHICAILLLCVLLFVLFSSFVPLISTEHNCVIDGCPVCIFMSYVNEFLGLLSAAAVSATAFALLKSSQALGILSRSIEIKCTLSPIALKVKLSD